MHRAPHDGQVTMLAIFTAGWGVASFLVKLFACVCRFGSQSCSLVGKNHDG